MKFTQLSYRERQKIYSGLCEQKSQREIADSLERSPSTISREISRNSDYVGYLYAGEAHAMAQKRKHKNSPQIDKNPLLKEYIIQRLKDRLSPKMIAGTWSLENLEQSITAETIYQWIYGTKGEALGLKKLLLRSRKKRGLRRKNRPAKLRIEYQYTSGPRS